MAIGNNGWRVVALWDGEAVTSATMTEDAIAVRKNQTGRVEDDGTDDSDWGAINQCCRDDT